MQTEQISQRIARIEDCADAAKNALQQAGKVPQRLQDYVQQLHQRASQAKHSPAGDERTFRTTVDELEQLADRALEECRKGSVDAKLQDAVKKAHAELSKTKHELEAHA